jgi:ribosomal protein S18 acetylase RimI-like enzyme
MSETIIVTAYTRLPDAAIAAVGALAAQVRASGVDPRLTLEWLASRTGARVADWLAHNGTRLAGVMATESFGDTTEATIAIAPDAPPGVAEALFAALLEELPRQGVRRALLLHDRGAAPLRRLAETHGLTHDHAELVMRRPGELGVPPVPPGPLAVRVAAEDELPLVARVMAADWGGEVEEVLAHLHTGVARGYLYYLATFEGEPVAALNLQRIEGRPWIYGFNVLAPYRGRGFGRQTLAAALGETLEADPGDAFLEVEPTNLAAVGLYHSLGFAELRTFDYWAKELADGIHS